MEPITPNYFLLGRPSPNFPPGILLDKSVTISSSWNQAQQISDQFWSRFLKEYMPTLLKPGKWSTPTPNLQPGDLVWVLKDFTPRGFWPIARVDKVFPGADGVVQPCRLKTTYSYPRPVVKLSKIPVDIVNKS